MRRAAAIIWGTLPPLLLSALLHTTDSDVGGISGLASPSVLLSVVVISAPLVLLSFLSLWATIKAGPKVSAAILVLSAGVVALPIVAYGSTASTPFGLAWSFLGSSAVVLVFLSAAVLPARQLGWNPDTGRS